jgi:hypothetical protein
MSDEYAVCHDLEASMYRMRVFRQLDRRGADWRTEAELSGRIRTCGQNKLHAHLFGEERVHVGASKTNGSTTPAWQIAIRSSRLTRTIRGISLKWHGSTRGRRQARLEATSKPRMAPDSSKGSAPATFTPKRLATRGTGQAGTQRAAEHG